MARRDLFQDLIDRIEEKVIKRGDNSITQQEVDDTVDNFIDDDDFDAAIEEALQEKGISIIGDEDADDSSEGDPDVPPDGYQGEDD